MEGVFYTGRIVSLHICIHLICEVGSSGERLKLGTDIVRGLGFS